MPRVEIITRLLLRWASQHSSSPPTLVGREESRARVKGKYWSVMWPPSPVSSQIITTIMFWFPPVLGGSPVSHIILPPVMRSAWQCLIIKILTSNGRLESMTGKEPANGCRARWESLYLCHVRILSVSWSPPTNDKLDTTQTSYQLLFPPLSCEDLNMILLTIHCAL